MNILLPIETINRELDFKLVLAGYLSGQGHQIYIGQHDFLMRLVPLLNNGGIYIGKNIFNADASEEKGEKYYFLKKNKFDIIYLNEEGAVFFKGEESMIERLEKLYNLNFFDENDHVCVWGNLQQKLEKRRSTKVEIHCTGHPRFDLCKKEWHSLYETKVDKIKKTYNNFILINGNFSAANPGNGIEHYFNEEKMKDEKVRLENISTFAYQSGQLLSMVKLTHHLASAFPELNFIYRPHPSEDHNYYKILFAGAKNIHVKHDGNVINWILASKLLIHDGCTTAIEATLAGVPVVNYKLNFDVTRDIWFPNQMGEQIDNFDKIISYIKKIEKEDLKLSIYPKKEEVLQYLYNFKGNSYEAFLKIIDPKIDKNKTNSKVPSLRIKQFFLEQSIRDFLIKILKPNKRKHLSYHNTKFYGFHEHDVNEKFKNISKILNKKIIYKFHNSHLVSIQ